MRDTAPVDAMAVDFASLALANAPWAVDESGREEVELRRAFFVDFWTDERLAGNFRLKKPVAAHCRKGPHWRELEDEPA